MPNQQRKAKRSLFSDYNYFSYVVSYFLVSLIPLIVLGILIFSGFIRIIKTNRHEGNYFNLVTVSQKIDSELIGLKQLSAVISQETELSEYNLTKNPFRSMRAIENLKNYVSSRSLLHDICLYSIPRSHLHTSTSAFAFDFYIKNSSFYGSTMNTEIKKLFSGEKSVILAGERANYISKLLNISNVDIIAWINPLNIYQSVCFLINKHQLKKYIQTEVLEKYNGITAIFDGNYSLIMVSGQFLTESNLFHILDAMSSKVSDRISISGTYYLASKITSPRTGLTYLNLIEDSIFMHDIRLLRRITFAILVAILFACSSLIAYLTYKNYFPLKAVKLFVSSLVDKPPSEDNIVDYIHLALIDISAQQKKMRRTISTNKDAAKHFILLYLLNGGFSDVAKTCGVEFTKNYFAVLIINFPENIKGQEKIKEKVIYSIERLLEKEIQGYGSESFNESNLIFILCSDYGNDTRNFRHIEIIKNEIFAKYGFSLTFGLGQFYTDFSDIGRSYVEALTAIDYRFIKGRDNLIFINDIPQEIKRIDWYPEEEVRSLYIYFRQRDRLQINNVLSSIIHKLEQEGTTLFLARCICYDIIRAIILIMSELNITLENTPDTLLDVTSLMQADTLTVLLAMVRNMANRICDSLDAYKRTSDDQLLHKISGYIHEHFSDKDFSVQSMADSLRISPSYLSMYYKSKTGEGALHYINELRIKKVKQLLANTDYTVSRIVTEVGYFNESSFIRKFKLSTGITPGEYRQLGAKAFTE
jgi:AraC-like DNA-binding protein